MRKLDWFFVAVVMLSWALSFACIFLFAQELWQAAPLHHAEIVLLASGAVMAVIYDMLGKWHDCRNEMHKREAQDYWAANDDAAIYAQAQAVQADSNQGWQ